MRSKSKNTIRSLPPYSVTWRPPSTLQASVEAFDAADPENRLVADELERRWNQALQQAQPVQGSLMSTRAAKSSVPHPVARRSCGCVNGHSEFLSEVIENSPPLSRPQLTAVADSSLRISPAFSFSFRR